MIEVSDVVFRYGRIEEPVVNHLSVVVHPGETLAIMGANGSGKSTVARMMNALLIPETGKVIVDGLDISKEQERGMIRAKVGMVFQNPDNQRVGSTVEDDVAFGLENLGVETREMRQRVRTALERMGLETLAETQPDKLSGGEKQRVAIAGILAMKPNYIIFDEAGSMLDPKGRLELLKIISELKEQGIGIVLITQQPEEAVVANRLLVLYKGQLALEGTPRQVLSLGPELLSKYGLDTTIMNHLAHRLGQYFGAFPKDILTLEEMVRALC